MSRLCRASRVTDGNSVVNRCSVNELGRTAFESLRMKAEPKGMI